MTLSDAYDPELFRSSGHRLVDALADHLQRARAGTGPVLPSVPPQSLLEELPADFPARGSEDLVQSLVELVARSNHLHHPGYVGHQVSAPLPPAALVELTSALLNNGMAIYEMGQAQTVMERHVLAFLAARLGFPAEADGVLTHGGSLGNLTALLAARQARAGTDTWSEGQSTPLAVLVSDQAHYCIARAVQCMGWGAGGAVAVPTDERYRLRPDALAGCLEHAWADGRRVIAVVASSCSTATGSFDPLPEMADFCAEHGLWLHVDGAHGASLALSRAHRHRLEGIERADSVVWDLHKLMALPAVNTAVVFRDGRRSYEAFAQEASYLFQADAPDEEWFNVARRTLECTKRALGTTAYLMLRTLGTEAFEQNVDTLIARTRELAQLLEQEDDFELATAPEANILCFRHTPPGEADLDALQLRIRRRVVERGRFYLVQTRARERNWLRVTIMNPFTGTQELRGLVDEVRAAAR